MFCKRCGNHIKPEDRFCGKCGLPLEQQPQIERIILTVAPVEAAQGCQKVVQMPGLSAPLRITLQPGVREGQTLVVHNAYFSCPDGRQENRPLYVTVRIVGDTVPVTKSRKKRKWWFPVAVILLIVLAVIGFFVRGEQKRPFGGESEAIDETSRMPTTEEAVQRVVENLNEVQLQWADENGYVAAEDLEESLDAACQVLEKEQSVTFHEKNDTCVYFECEDGRGYVYMPELEEFALGGSDLQIVTVQPYFTENIQSDTIRRYDHYALDENAAQIGAQYEQWSFYDVDSTDDDNINDNELTIERMLSLGDYKLILWHGHGSYSKSRGYIACSTIRATEELESTYKELFDRRYIIKDTQGDLHFTEAFFEKCFLDNAFEGAVIYMGTCYSGYSASFAQILLDKGAAAVYVNSNVIRRDYNLNMLRAVGQNLCRGDTVTQALANAQIQHGASMTMKRDTGEVIETSVYCVAQEWAKDQTLQQLAVRLSPQPKYLTAYDYVLTEELSWQAGEDISYNNYTLYDIDLDGTPELIAELGSSEADSYYLVYTAIEEEPICLGMFSGSHSVLYGEVSGGITVMSGHMGSETCRTVSINDGMFSESLLYMAEVEQYWDELCDVRPLQMYALDDLTGLHWEGNSGYDNWSALEPARARVFP